MRVISREALQALRERYPRGTRVKLVQMDDPRHRPSVRKVQCLASMTLAASWLPGTMAVGFMLPIPATALATKGDSITFSTPTIEGTILRRNKADAKGNHPWKAAATEGSEGVTAGTIANWYKEVYEPSFADTNLEA